MRDATLVEAGYHEFSKEHYRYNLFVKNLWSNFFHDMDPTDITEPMARMFVESVKHNRNAKRILGKILVKGGTACAIKGGAKLAGKALKVVPLLGTIIMVYDEAFNVEELY